MKFLYFDKMGSTQDYVKDLAAKGEVSPLWVRVGAQDAGRGRRGRQWVSKPGNLYTSGLYPWNGPTVLKPLSSFVVALAVADTLASYIDPAKISLKWPNDVLVDGAKIAGILLEAGDGWITIGVGINLEHHPEGLPYPVTHLLEHISAVDLDDAEPLYSGADPILAQLAKGVSAGLAILQEQGFAPIRTAWLDRAARLGEPITINLGPEQVSGTFETLGENGALQLRLANGTLRKVLAGDVLL